MDKYITLSEKFGERGYKNNYVLQEGKNVIVLNEQKTDKFTIQWILNGCRTFLHEVFLPQGYPESVSHDYYEYQFWDSIQAFCSNISGILSTHSILKEVGVGDSSATALAATIVWILKDASSMLSKITFAWWKGYTLDTDCKKWRFGADVINDIALGIEIMLDSALLKPVSSIMLCVSTCLKAIVGVAGGATRAAVTQHQAIRGNSGDVSAKDGSQEMCVNFVASFVGLFILTHIENNKLLIWLLYVCITFIHLYSNYQAVHCLIMETLNTERFNLLIKNYIEKGIVEDPGRVNKEESVLVGHGLSDKKLCGYQIYLGTSLQKSLEKVENSTQMADIIHSNKHKRYFIMPFVDNKQMNVIFRKGVTCEEILRAYFQAAIIALANNTQERNYFDNCLYAELKETTAREWDSQKLDSNCLTILLDLTDKIANKYWNPFLQGMKQKGWDLSTHQLSVDEWRVTLED